MRKSNRSRTPRAVLALSIASLLAGYSASAANVNWDPTATGGAGGTGTGNWDTTSNFWWNGTADTTWVNGNNDTAIFGNAASATTVTLTTGITAGGLTFNSSNYTVTGNTLTLAGSTPTITVTNLADTATISSILAGSAGLTTAGAGTLVLSGANTYTGGTTVTSGTLSIGSDANLGNVSGALTLNGGTLKITAGGQTLNTARGVVLGASGATIDTSSIAGTGITTTVAGVISGAGPLTLKSTGNLTASGGGDGGLGIKLANAANTFTGDVTITSGLVSYANDSSFGATGNKIILNGGGLLDNNVNVALSRDIQVLAGGGTFRTYGSANVVWSGAITGSGNINRTDGGTLTLSGDLSGYTGTYDNQGGSTNLTGTAATIGGNWKVSANTLTINSSANQTLAGAVSGTGGFAKSGNGTLTLNGASASTYTGATTVNAGRLKVDLSNLSTPTNLLASTSALNLNGGTFEVVGKSGSASSQTLGNLTLGAGHSQIVLTGNGATSLGLTLGNTWTRNGNATLDIALNGNTLTSTPTALNPNGIVGGYVTVNNGADWAALSGGNVVGYSGYTVGLPATGGVATTNYSQAGSLALTGAVTANSLKLTDTGASQSLDLGTNSLTLTNTAGLLYAGGTSNTYAITGTGILGAGAANEFIVQTASGANLSIATPIIGAGAGSLTKGGTGTLTLTGANSYTGATNINGGTLSIADFASLGTTGTINLRGGTIQYTGATATIARNFNTTAAGGGTLDIGSGVNLTTTGTLVGGATNNVVQTLIKTGAGTLTLAGTADNNSGHVVINGGTVVLAKTSSASVHAIGGAGGLDISLTINSGGTAQLGGTGGDQVFNNSAVAVNSGGTFDMNGLSEAFDTLLGAGTVTNTAASTTGTLTLGQNNSTATLASALQDGAGVLAFAKAGNGTLTLPGSYSYSGSTSVIGGTLNLDYSTNNTSKLSNTGALILGSTLNLTGGSHNEVVGSTTLNTNTASTISRTSGTSTVALGSITRNAGASLNLPTAGVASTPDSTSASGAFGSWLTIGGTSLATKDGSNNIVGVTYADTAIGGSIADSAASHVRLTGATGTINLAAATTNAATLTQAATGATTIDTTNKVLRLSPQGAILVATGGGALTIGTTANFGVLTAGGSANTAGTLDFNTRGSSVTVNSIIADNGTGVVSLTKFGANDLILSGINSYSAGTTLSGGVLRVRGNSALGTGAVTVDNSATLATAAAGAIASLNNSIGVASGTTLSVDSGFAQLTLNGAITGAGNLSTASSGVTVLAGANTYTGTTAIGTGNISIFSGLQIGADGTTGSLGAGAINFGGYGNNLTYARSNSATIGNAITGAGSVIMKSGTLTLSGGAGNTYSGDTVVYGGTLQLSASNNQNIGSGRLIVYPGGTAANTTTHVFGVGTSTNVQLLGGTFSGNANEFYVGNLDMAGGTMTGTGNEIRFSASRTINVVPSVNASTLDRRLHVNAIGTNTATFLVNDGPATDDLLVSQNISSGTSIVKSGLGTLRSTTSTAHGYTGSTVLNAGVFNLDFSGSSLTSNMLNTASAPTFAGGNLTITGKSATANAQSLGATTLNAGGSSITLAPGASGGTATLTLGAVTRNVGSTLAVTLPAGATLTASPTLTNGVLPYSVVNGSDFATVSGGNVVANATYSNDDYSANTNTNVAALNPSPATFSNNTLSFRTAQANTVTLTGANTTGAVLVASNVGANATSISGAGTIQGTSGGELIINQFNTGGALTIGSNIINNGAATALVKSGPGTLILSGTNTYTGTTYLNGGTTQFTTQANIGNSTGAITFGGGALQWATGSTVDVTTGRTVTIGPGGATFDTNGNNVTLATALGAGSSGTLVKNGAGTLTLSANNANFSGSVVVNAGKLVGSINGTGGFGPSQTQSFIVNTGGTLEISSSANHSTANIRNFYVNGGTLQNTSGIAIRMGNIWLNGGTLNTQGGASGSYTAMYLGTLQANTQGANATVFVEGSTPSQITTSGGSNNTIQLGPNVLFQVADVTGNANADLTVSVGLQNQSQDQAQAAAALTKRGNGTMAISAQSSYTGGTFVEQGVLNLTGGGGTNGTIRGPVSVSSGATLRLSTGDATGFGTTAQINSLNLNGGTLDVNTTSNQTISNCSIVLTGASITGIAGSNIDLFNNGTSITTNASATSSTISVPTMNLRQNDTQFSIADGAAAVDLVVNSNLGNGSAGNHNLIKNGAGTMSLTGTNGFTGTTTINAGTLLVSGSITGTGAVGVNSGGTLGGTGSVAGATTVNAGGTLSPGASIGTLSLTNGLTFNGGGTFKLEINTSTLGTDVAAITGGLSLGTTAPTLSLSDLGSNVALALDTKFTFITYTGAWDGNVFQFAGNPVADDSSITFGANTYRVDYNDAGGVSLTVVPEPGAAMAIVGGAAMLLGLRRRPRRS